MRNHVDVAIVGAGSAGLSALRQVKKVTDNYLLIDPGPLGTTCARVGCMPSKALIHIANDYHRRRTFADMGISGAKHLRCDIPAVLRHVRTLRDRFTAGMIKATRDLAGERFVEDRAVLVGPKRVRVGDRLFDADRIILAPGARPLDSPRMETLGVELDETLISPTIGVTLSTEPTNKRKQTRK